MNKKLFVVFLFIVFGPFRGFTQLIPWQPGYLLTWSDFMGPIPHDGYSAETRWDYRYHYNWAGDGTLTITVNCSFDKRTSWKDPSKNLTPKLLLHEELHFYAAEMYARKMRQSFGNYAMSHKHSPNTDSDLSQLFNKLKAECDNYQSEYDIATKHGMNPDAQEEWRKKIVSDLQALNSFEAK